MAEFPIEKDGVKIGLAALPEDVTLKGFPPLLDAQKKRCFQVSLSRMEQVRMVCFSAGHCMLMAHSPQQTVSRVITLLTFGHFVSDLRVSEFWVT